MMKKLITVILSCILVFSFAACGSSSNSDEESHIYDNAKIEDVMNGTGTDKIGEYSLIEISSDDLTDEALNDWYFNYVEKNEDLQYNVIVYTDKDGIGTIGQPDLVRKDVYITQDNNGVWGFDNSKDDTDISTYYLPEDGELVVSAEPGEK